MFEALVQPMRRSFHFRGRARRSEYWDFVLWQLAILAAVLNLVTLFPPGEGRAGATTGVLIGYVLVFFLPTLSAQVRRLHNHGTSGWMLTIGFLPYIGVGWMLWLLLASGTLGPNRYGDDPRQVTLDEALFG